jgi:hypothetical protein
VLGQQAGDSPAALVKVAIGRHLLAQSDGDPIGVGVCAAREICCEIHCQTPLSWEVAAPWGPAAMD